LEYRPGLSDREVKYPINRLKDFLVLMVTIFILSLSLAFGQASQLSYGWTKTFGGALLDHGHGITIDSLGNIYATGEFRASVNFGLDFGTTDNKTSAGYWDAFVAKISACEPPLVFGGHEFDKLNPD
jgi:hypothetical protein